MTERNNRHSCVAPELPPTHSFKIISYELKDTERIFTKVCVKRQPPGTAVSQHYFKRVVKRIPAVMAGRGRGGRGGGRNNNNNNNSGRGGRGGHGVTRTRVVKTGLNKELEGNIFDLGERSLANLMRNTQIKITQYIGSLYGGDFMGELKTKKEFVATPTEYPQTAIDRKANYINMIRAQQTNALTSLRQKEQRLKIQIAVTATTNVDQINRLEEQLSDVENKIL